MIHNDDFFERKKREIGVSLNDVQKQAVLHTVGPLLLLASPGSGKTTTTIMRIGYLIEEKGIQPSRIKAVTFSRAAAKDMEKRFARFFPNHFEKSVDFSTIHSLAFEVVRDYFRKKRIEYTMIEGKQEQQTRFHKKIILRKLFKEETGENISEEQMEGLTTYISFIKNKLVPEKEWSRVQCDVPQAEQILKKYESFKKAASHQILVDFDDMLTLANVAFSKDKTLLKQYQQRYDFVLTDESQDTSMVQHSIIEKLVHVHKNLYVVADDDQSIYTWRAAEPQYLLNFNKVYPNAKILMMEQNYRSSKEIVEVANQFIKQNKNRYDKNMFTENPPHTPITIRRLDDYKFQSKYLVTQLSAEDYFQDIAVLFRNNSSAIIIVNELDRAGIPFYIKDHDTRFFSHWVVKDVLNLMRMTFNDRRADIFAQIYPKLNLFVSKEQVKKLNISNHQSVFDNLMALNELSPIQIKKIKSCQHTFQMMKGKPPKDVIKMIRVQLGYEEKIIQMSQELGFIKENILGILYTLEEIADSLQTMEEFASRLKHLEKILKSSLVNKQANVVTLSTFHSSKGLEFKKVYMVDLIEGVIPSKEELDAADEGNPELLEESVRLFYVAMTRAELQLELVYYCKKFGKSVSESRFIHDIRKIVSQVHATSYEIPKKKKAKIAENGMPEIPYNPNAIKRQEELMVNQTVKHRVFGSGEIVNLDEDKIEIRFQRGSKTLSVKTCIEFGLLEPI